MIQIHLFRLIIAHITNLYNYNNYNCTFSLIKQEINIRIIRFSMPIWGLEKEWNLVNELNIGSLVDERLQRLAVAVPCCFMQSGVAVLKQGKSHLFYK